MQQGSCTRGERHSGKFWFPLWPKAKCRNLGWAFQGFSRPLVGPYYSILKASAFDSNRIDLANNFGIAALSLSLLFCNRWREYISWSIWGSTENMNVDFLDIQHCLAYVQHAWLSIRRTGTPVMKISYALISSKVRIEDRTTATCSKESFAAYDNNYKVYIYTHLRQ